MRLPFNSSKRINTPGKRLGLLALTLGASATVVSLLLFIVLEFRAGYWGDVWQGLFFGWPEQFWRNWNNRHESGYRNFCYGGAILATVGWSFSYGYDATLNRFVRWVRTGSI